jgi:putative restriction endonuclease
METPNRRPTEPQLSIGQTLTQQEVQEAFNTDFGYQFTGITYRNTDEGKYVILLSNEGEFYSDQISGGQELVYEGEGVPEKGDQTLTTRNQALVDATEDPIPIYFFTSREGADAYEYQGLVEVLSHRYVKDQVHDRMVYRYDLRKLGVASWNEFIDVDEEIQSESRDTPEIQDEPDRTTRTVAARDAAFSRRIKEQYDYTCAICGTRRLTPDENPEVEAAHIVPRAEGGPDDLRNGLALCKLHHWAFDCGWIAIDDDLGVVVNSRTEVQTPDVVENVRGQTLSEPTDFGHRPHQTYLQAHRELHGF